MQKILLTGSALIAALAISPMACAQTNGDLYAKDIPRTLPLGCGKVATSDRLRAICSRTESLPSQEIADDSSLDAVRIPLVLSAGTPLRIAIDQSTRISHVGEEVHGQIVETVYVFDEPVIPAGSRVRGRVIRIEPVSTLRRVESYANADFTPFRRFAVTFDRITLIDGREIAIETTVSPASAHVVHLVSKRDNDSDDDKKGQEKHGAARAADAAKQAAKETAEDANNSVRQAELQIRTPGRMQRFKEFLVAQMPFRRQYLSEGTRFSASLNQPLDFGSITRSQDEIAAIGTESTANLFLHAHLLIEVSSATATRGSPVVAEVTEPVYSADHRLVLPSQTRLIGQVVEAKPARRLHRNGELRVIFEHIEIPGGDLQRVQGSLEGIEVDREARLKLDEEGGAHATDSKTRYLSTGVALLMAVAAAHPDVDRGNFSEAGGDPVVRAGAGASGFGLAGTLIGLAAKSNVVSIVFSAYGASASIYSNFLSRGREVVLPKDVPMEIGLGSVHPETDKR